MFHLSKDRKKKLISVITLNDTLYKQEKRNRKSQRCHKIIRNTYVYEKKKNLWVNSKLFKEVLVFRTLGITSKKQDRSFIEDLLHHLHFWAFQGVAKALEVFHPS